MFFFTIFFCGNVSKNDEKRLGKKKFFEKKFSKIFEKKFSTTRVPPGGPKNREKFFEKIFEKNFFFRKIFVYPNFFDWIMTLQKKISKKKFFSKIFSKKFSRFFGPPGGTLVVEIFFSKIFENFFSKIFFYPAVFHHFWKRFRKKKIVKKTYS